MSRSRDERMRIANAKDARVIVKGGNLHHPEPTTAPAHWKRNQSGKAVRPSTPAPLVISGKRTTLGDLFDRSLARMDALREGLDA